MLWDIIRDFIVEHITGGINSNGTLFDVTIGRGFYENGADEVISGELMFDVGNGFAGDTTLKYITFSDWFATTLTAICMCLLVAFAIWLVRWVFKAVSSAFLLKR